MFPLHVLSSNCEYFSSLEAISLGAFVEDLVEESENGLYVRGLLPININDFKLKAPTKMLGIVKVSPQIEIDFSLEILKS